MISLLQFCLVFALSVLMSDVAAAKGKAPAIAAEADVHDVFIVPSTVKGTARDAKLLRAGKIESIELRYHTSENHFRGGLYFEAIHHVPGSPDVALGGREIEVLLRDGKTVTKQGLNYDDYNYSYGYRLRKDFDELWEQYVWKYAPQARNTTSAVLTGSMAGGMIYASWKVVQIAVASKSGFFSAAGGIASQIAKNPFTWLMSIPLANEYVAKPIYRALNWIPDYLTFGRELAERDLLYSLLSQAYENATYGAPIDTSIFNVASQQGGPLDIDAAFKEIMAAKNGQQAQAQAQDQNQNEQPKAAPVIKPAVSTVPIADFKFTLRAMKNFFIRYVEDNIEAGRPAPKNPLH